MSALRRTAEFLNARPALSALAVLVLTVAVYANTLTAGFVWDDASSILLHQHVKDPSKVFALFQEDQHAFAGGQGNFYRPLLSVTFMIDYAIARMGAPAIPPTEVPKDLNPFVFHLSSVLWHAAAAVLLLLYLRKIGAPIGVYLPVAALFAAHPLHTEAVAYVSGRADSMAAAFIFAGLYFAASRTMISTILMLMCFVAGLLSKEAAFVFPGLLLLSRMATRSEIERARSAGRFRSWAPEVGAIVSVGVYFGLRATVLNFGSDTVARAASWALRLQETFQVFALYLRLIFIPTHLHMERTLDGVPTWFAVAGFAALVTLIMIAVGAYRRGERRAAFGIAWFLVAWLPISGLFPLNAPMAEHWMYVPLAGLLFGGAELIHALSARSNRPVLASFATVLAAAWLVMLCSFTAIRNRDWHDDESLYIATLRENPNSTRVHFNLAVIYEDVVNNPAGALRHFTSVTRAYEKRKEANPSEATNFWSDELEAYVSLGDIYAAEHRYAEAFTNYRVLLGVAPTGPNKILVAEAAYGAGRCFLATGEISEARNYLQKAAQLAPALQPEVERLLPSRSAPASPEGDSKALHNP